MLRRIDELTRINVRIKTKVDASTVEHRQPDYPLVALQQLLQNAVLHRTYEVNGPILWYWFSDRIEIHSPSGLYGRVNEQNFGIPGATDYRNPTLSEGAKVLGFVQRFGMGIDMARRSCADNGNRAPEFSFSPHTTLALIRGIP